MHVLFPEHRQRTSDLDQRREYSHYLARQMGPMIHALMLMATLAYGVAVIASMLIRSSPVPLLLRLTLLLPLLLVAMAARHVWRPRVLSGLALLCVLLLEIGINLNSIGRLPGQPWVMPGLLLPVASSVIWLGRWDFAIAMALCALGPLPRCRHLHGSIARPAAAAARTRRPGTAAPGRQYRSVDRSVQPHRLFGRGAAPVGQGRRL